MKQPSTDKPRLVEAVEVAEDMFWNAIATAYPEIKTGDFPPDLAMEMADKLTQFVTVWLKMNESVKEIDASENKTTEVMLHRIEYYYRDNDDMEITDSDEEHIAYCISQGCGSGELCTLMDDGETEVFGWWNINNCPDA